MSFRSFRVPGGPLERELILSESISEEIARLLAAQVDGLFVSRNGAQQVATLAEVRDALLAQGLELTTADAVTWSTQYPGFALDIERIRRLEEEIIDLRIESAKISSQ